MKKQMVFRMEEETIQELKKAAIEQNRSTANFICNTLIKELKGESK